MKLRSRPQHYPPEKLREIVVEVLKTFRHPTLTRDLASLEAIHHVVLMDAELHIEVRMPFAWAGAFELLKDQTSAILLERTGAEKLDWHLSHDIATLKRVANRSAVRGVKNILAISSAKGGVGKSSLSANLALALAAEGAKVGLLDADIYGPSIPLMFGTENQRPISPDGKHMVPIKVHDIETHSVGYLMNADNAVVWRGPMASKALIQLLNETLWPDLDYLILDMPPGTGDIQITLAKSIPLTAAIVVTTPQEIALNDARKGIIMFEKVAIPLLGIVENMSIYVCSHCGHQDAIFGLGGAISLSEQYRTLVLGQIPLDTRLREDLDSGEPTVFRSPQSDLSKLFRQLAGRVASELYWQGEVILPDIAFHAS